MSLQQAKNNDDKFEWIWCIYLLVSVLVYALANSIQVLMWKLNVFLTIYYLVAAAGGALMVADFFRKRILFTSKYCLFLILFIVALMISAISNMRYGIVGNIQAIVWFLIHFFVLAAVDTDLPRELHMKQLRIVMNAFGVVWFALVLWSLVQYVTQFSSLVFDIQCGWDRRVGFTDSRLFGTFRDPNYASVTCAAAIAFAVFNLLTKPKCTALKIFSWAQIVAQLCYIVLAESRTLQLGLLVVVAFLAALYGWKFAEKRTQTVLLRIVLALAAVLLSTAVSVLLYKAVQIGLSYLPVLFGYADGRIGTERADVVGTSDYTNGRIEVWTSYIELTKNKPLFGLSPRNAVAYAQEYFPDSYVARTTMTVHSGYVGLLAYSGVVGAAIMLCWMVLVVVEIVGYLIRRRNSADSCYHVILVLSMFLIVAAVAAGPQMLLFYSNRIYDILFWITLGYVRAFICMSEPERYAKMPLPYRVTERMFARLKKNRQEP